MGFLGSLFGRQRNAPPPVREMLFGGMALDEFPRAGGVSDVFPWSAFVQARRHLAAGRAGDSLVIWRGILQHPGLEPRHYLQAWHFLRLHGEQPAPEVAKQLLGVVVEVAMPEGLDLLAAYPDHSARYHNYSGAAVVWERPNPSLDAAIDQLLATAAVVVAQIGPWDQSRPGPPAKGQIRMSFLTPSGLHFGQGPMEALSADPLGGPVVAAATVLMRALVAKARGG